MITAIITKWPAIVIARITCYWVMGGSLFFPSSGFCNVVETSLVIAICVHLST